MNEKEIFAAFSSSADGLSDEEAKARLKEYGHNEIPRKEVNPLQIFAGQFRNPFFIILIAAVGISYFLGDALEAAVIFAILFIGALFGFYDEYKSEKIALLLSKKISYRAMTSATEGKKRYTFATSFRAILLNYARVQSFLQTCAYCGVSACRLTKQ